MHHEYSFFGLEHTQVAEGHEPKTQPCTVSDDYPQGANAFTGRIRRVTVAQR